MFGKLLKYELRSVMKDFLFIWIGILVLSTVNAFTMGLGNDPDVDGFMAFLLIALPLMVLFALYVAAFVVALLYVIQRFYRGLLGSEGYLMFTLPVTPTQLLAAKALTALILEVVSVLVALIGGAIILVVQIPPDTWGFTLGDVWQEVRQLIGNAPMCILLGVEFLLLMLLSACQANLHLYAGMSLGHLAKKNRAVWSAVAVVGLNMALSTLSAIAGRLLGGLSLTIDLSQLQDLSVVGGICAVLGVACLYSAAICVLWFFLSRYILRNNLNLE